MSLTSIYVVRPEGFEPPAYWSVAGSRRRKDMRKFPACTKMLVTGARIDVPRWRWLTRDVSKMWAESVHWFPLDALHVALSPRKRVREGAIQSANGL